MMSSNGLKDVRILLLGDRSVGKTSLIFSLVSEEFPEEVPAKAEEICIPPDVTPERVSTQIVDFSTQEQSNENLSEEIRKANVICVVYSVENDDTIDRITSYWLPLLRDQLGEDHNTPVVLVGNKVDLVDQHYTSLEHILAIMNQYSEVETCVECSAKTLKNISELFFYAQKAVLYPTAPLYATNSRELTDDCMKALARIFKLCDLDNDGVLNDHELNRFQIRCFGNPLQYQALEDVKNIVKRGINDGVFEEGLTLNGFLFLHICFIQRGRHETVWTVLRKFGYVYDGTSIVLSEHMLHPTLIVPKGCTTELSQQGYQFLVHLFEKFDQDKDGALSPNELGNLFSVCPKIPSYFSYDIIPNCVRVNENGYIKNKSFLSLWTLMASIDIKTTLEMLAYLGYITPPEEDALSAILVTRDKRLDFQYRQTTRNVFNCHIIGPKGAGKSSFMLGFLDKTLQSQMLNCSSFSNSNYAISTVSIYNQEKYLILKEVDIYALSQDLSEPDLLCDVVSLMYDASNPRSFEYIAHIYLKHFTECKIPILVVALKSDELPVRQHYVLQPDEFCAKYHLARPISFTVNDLQVKREVFNKLGMMAVYPNLRRLVHALLARPTPNWVTQQFSSFQECLPEGSTLVRTGVGIATLAIVGLFILRLMRTVNIPHTTR